MENIEKGTVLRTLSSGRRKRDTHAHTHIEREREREREKRERGKFPCKGRREKRIKTRVTKPARTKKSRDEGASAHMLRTHIL